MKKILSIILIAIAISVSFTSCDNKPPFVRLANAIDSLNMEHEQITGSKEKLITYDKWENELTFHQTYSGHIDSDVFGPIAEHEKEVFLLNLCEDRYDIASEILDAHANVVLKITGDQGGEYEVLIVTNEIAAAYDALHNEENTPLTEGADNEYQAEDEQLEQARDEIMETNLTPVE